MKPLDESAHDVLQAGRATEGPTAADRERVRGKLAIAIAAGAAGPAIAAPAMKAAAKWWASKTVIGIVSASVVAVSAAVVLTRSNKVKPPDNPPPVVQPVVATAPVAEEEEDEVDAVDDTAPPSPSPTSAPVPVPVKKVKRKKKTAPKEVAEVEAPPPISTPPPQVVEPSKKDDTLEAETQGLREVHAALRAKDNAKALSLIDEQDRRFPLGQLRPEREAAKVLAMCASEPKSGTTALAQFVERHPGSPLLPRLRAACAK